MVNYIWVFLTVIGIVFAMFNGTMHEVNQAIFQGAKDAVTLCIGLISILVFWLGMMRIAEEAGILKGLAKLFKPIVKPLFPEVPENHPAMGYILSNIIANMFGLGNAATPLGLKAMEQLQHLNKKKDMASRSMVTFLAINTASVTILPTTVIAIRMNYHSVSPAEIVVPTLIVTLLSAIGAVAIDRYYFWRRSRKG
ncbi:spore maturation protein [Neobacillus notoginsengisoli]|uniref:Spore maturation protein n=1 Tax=Neobacillus notoginsengisoli TaxID=1578198 RepID=A0A417YV77_9BACI|nr:nucleoside recognition domain-containing protein [Neobacillus notoginsengisoli]RHW41204.1 spore maturation protein [Neobacillus notoginsengisoli]